MMPATQPLQYARTPYGYYMRLGGQFKANGITWIGSAIAGPEAIYLMKASRQNDAATTGFLVGGLVGGLIAGAIAKATEKPDMLRSCTYFQLPEAVRAHPDWPAKKRTKDCDVIVVSRPYVDVIRYNGWTSSFRFHVAGFDYSIRHGLFQKGKVKRFLAASGWTLEA
jgi:hypothetical protein